MDLAINLRKMLLLMAVCFSILAGRAAAQQQPAPEDPEDDKQLGLWLDQGISSGLTPNKSLEIEFYERYDEVISKFYEYFIQGGVAFRVRPWLAITPMYRYQRFPGNPVVAYENRLLLNVTLATTRGPWRPNLRVMPEERFPDNRQASTRIRIRPGIDYTLPFRMKRRPVIVVSNEFFVVPGTNSFAAGGSFTQNRFQVGVRFPITDSFSIRPYYLLQSVNLPSGWETNEIIGFSMAIKLFNKNK
jgi:Protein of unknown function (DUF2490)